MRSSNDLNAKLNKVGFQIPQTNPQIQHKQPEHAVTMNSQTTNNKKYLKKT